MAFNKADFCVGTVFLPLWARLVMEQDPERRSAASVQRLASLLRTIKKFNDNLDSEKQEEFCRFCQYAKLVVHSYMHMKLFGASFRSISWDLDEILTWGWGGGTY